MLTTFNQNWRTTHLPFSLALANTITTGVSFDTPSGATRNSQIWGRAGFRGLGPVLTFPGGSGMDGMKCHCGMGQLDLSTPVDYGLSLPAPVQNITSAFGSFGWVEWLIIAGVGYMLLSTFLTTSRGVRAASGAYKGYSERRRRRAKARAELASI